jgi:hypothetical protein
MASVTVLTSNWFIGVSSEAVTRLTDERFIQVLENAFWRLGGVPKVVVFDNGSFAVKHADWYDAEHHPKFVDFCKHYGFASRHNAYEFQSAICGRCGWSCIRLEIDGFETRSDREAMELVQTSDCSLVNFQKFPMQVIVMESSKGQRNES